MPHEGVFTDAKFEFVSVQLDTILSAQRVQECFQVVVVLLHIFAVTCHASLGHHTNAHNWGMRGEQRRACSILS